MEYTSSIAANLMAAVGLLSPGTSRVAVTTTASLSYAAPDTSGTSTVLQAHIPEELVSTGETANVGLEHGKCGRGTAVCDACNYVVLLHDSAGFPDQHDELSVMLASTGLSGLAEGVIAAVEALKENRLQASPS